MSSSQIAPSYARLDNGLRTVMRHTPDSPVEICGVVVNAGSRDEAPGEQGLAHLVEHTLFKGTGRRTARMINSRMEDVGGELNAYTTKEETFLYATFPAGYTARAIELTADLVTDSRFPADEVERERDVVCDEIDSYLDSPGEAIFDDFEELAYAGSPVAHNILGDKATVQKLDGTDCRRFIERFYTPARMVFFYQGPASPKRAAALANRYFGSLDRADTPVDRTPPPVVRPFDIAREAGCHQTHCVIAARVPGLRWQHRHALYLLTNSLGGPGMNSMLNLALRERRGLVYSVDASTSLLTDTGLMSIYLGCDHDDLRRCRRLTTGILSRVADELTAGHRLENARRQYLGQLTLASVNVENSALAMARSVLHRGRVASRDEVVESVMSVSRDDIAEVGALLRPDLCSTLCFV